MVNPRISTRLWLMAGISLVVYVMAIGVSLYSMKTAEHSLKSVYETSAQPMEMLAGIDSLLRENRADVFRTFLHDPARPIADRHGHPVTVHLGAIAARIVVADQIWQAYMETAVTVKEQTLADDFVQKRTVWLTHMTAALDAVRAGDYGDGMILSFAGQGNSAFQAAMEALARLRAYQVEVARHEFKAAEARHRNSLIVFFVLAVLGGAGMTGSTYLALRRINRGLSEAGVAAQALAAGNFAVSLPPRNEARRDEIDELMIHFATMRDGLRDRVGELRAGEARSRAILRTMRDGVVHIDSHGTILLINDVIGEMFGYEEDELIGRNVSMLMPEPYRNAHDGYLVRYLSTREPHIVGLKRREVEGERRDGSRFAMDLSVNEMVDDSGSTFIGVIRDITLYKEAQQELETALAAAQAAAEVKSRFLANMSHEIRTPINAVLGFTDLCLRLDLPARGRDYVEKVLSAAKSLLGIINDILDFSKIEAGKLEIEAVPFNLGEVLHGIASLFSLKAREKGIELVIGAQPSVPDRLVGDPLRLGQVLTNLTGNAIKFTEHGSVEVTVETVAAGDGGDETVLLRFVVHDSGVGMTPEQQAQLFNPFAQADSSTTRKYGGTGLGLAISKQLVERMGGAIEVRSKAGEGSTFHFTLPLRKASGEVARPPARTPMAGKLVLVVDDSAVMRTLLLRSVEAFGCEAAAVGTGGDALAILQAGAQFDLMLLDWHLPDVDGLTVARRIRETGNAVPIVLVTGDDPAEARARDVGHDLQAILAKPVSRSSLHDTLSDVLGGHVALTPLNVLRMPTPDLAGVRILLVDDNDFNRQVGRELIELTGATVVTANDGAAAVAAVESGGHDLVLMDLQMPVMDGYTAARRIRERWPDLAVIALTAHALVEERDRVLAAGMNDILTKPILPDVLYAMLVRWLPEQAQANPRAERTEPADAVPPAPTFAPASAPAPDVPGKARPVEGFDLDMALSRVNGDRKMLDRFLRLFRERNAGALAEISAAIGREDWPAARRLAHALKGGAGTIGLVGLQAAAARMEATLTGIAQGAGDDPARRNEDFATLEGAWAQALAALAELLDAPAPAEPFLQSGEA